MYCNFIQWKDNLFKCDKCGYITEYGKAYRICKYTYQSQYEESGPGLIRRLFNFTKAAIQHELQGKPTVTDEILQERLNVCVNCPSKLFKKIDDRTGICTHESCGCTIKDHQTYLNKIAWADQRCPMGHWDIYVSGIENA